jgi:hypothetical protein
MGRHNSRPHETERLSLSPNNHGDENHTRTIDETPSLPTMQISIGIGLLSSCRGHSSARTHTIAHGDGSMPQVNRRESQVVDHSTNDE